MACLLGLGVFALSSDRAGAYTYIPINLQADNGDYVVAENGGGGVVNANRGSAGPWESFTLIDLNSGSLQSGDYVYVQTYGFYYFNADYCGGYALSAVATFPSSYQTFRIWKVGGSGTIGNGDPVAFETYCGYYVVAEDGGGGVVNANRTSIGPWETFTISM
jgi:hypothetical protein